MTTRSQLSIKRHILREMRYISDQQGIMDSYLAEAEGWKSHLENSRSYILECIKRHRPSSVMVLGSGWLLDVPVEELAAQCDEVLFADIYHPVQVEHKIRKFKNCKLVYADLSGGAIESTYNVVRDFRKTGRKESLERIRLQEYLSSGQAGYFVSLNLMNQLDIILVDFIRKYINYSEEEENKFRQKIQEFHLFSLPPGRSCLITDFEELAMNSKNEMVKKKKLIHTMLPKGTNRKEWTWDFDTEGMYNPGMVTFMRVVALEL